MGVREAFYQSCPAADVGAEEEGLSPLLEVQ
jgi:hypothetical protein